MGTISNVVFSSATGTGSFDVAFSDGPAISTVSVQVEDSDGADSNVASIDVMVNNVAPTANLSNNGPVNEGSTATVQFATPVPNQVTYQFSGDVYWQSLINGGANPPLDGSVVVGTPITGTFSYNPAAAPHFSTANSATYPGGTLQATVGNYSLTSGFTIEIQNDDMHSPSMNSSFSPITPRFFQTAQKLMGRAARTGAVSGVGGSRTIREPSSRHFRFQWCCLH